MRSNTYPAEDHLSDTALLAPLGHALPPQGHDSSLLRLSLEKFGEESWQELQLIATWSFRLVCKK